MFNIDLEMLTRFNSPMPSNIYLLTLVPLRGHVPLQVQAYAAGPNDEGPEARHLLSLQYWSCWQGSRCRLLGPRLARLAFLHAWYCMLLGRWLGNLLACQFEGRNSKGIGQDRHQATCRVSLRPRASSCSYARHSRHGA